ncbi:hypothetical protein AOU00_20645 [Paenibacillus polymyxa]|nr:hypothetical protein AOU00_20645 [Paenibacillus polymyxa]
MLTSYLFRIAGGNLTTEYYGFSSRPIMPIAAKMLFSKEVLKEGARLIQQLKVSKDDIRILKLYNMMAVT